MKIRNRLSLEFTLLTAGIMLLVMLLLYGLFSDYVKQVFYHRLRDRALITAQVFLEKDELTKKSFLEIQQKYMRSLNGERSFIYNEENTRSFINDSSASITPALVNNIRQSNNNELFFLLQGKPAAGITYKDNQGDFVIIVTAENVTGRQHLNNLLMMLCITYIIGLAILFLLSKRFAGKALKPIVHVNDTIRQIRSGTLHERVIVPQNKDEINELANNFNELLSHLEHAFDMQRSFVSNASHELRTPLTSIIGELEVMLNKPRSQEEYTGAMRSVLAESEKLTVIINRLFELSKYDAARPLQHFEPVDIAGLLTEIMEYWKDKGSQYQFCFSSSLSEPVRIDGNKILLETAFNNVIRNAFKFSGNKPVTIMLSHTGESVLISIADEGIGFDPSDRTTLFQPFFRGSNARNYPGSGVGLSITEKIIRMHRGSVEAVLNESEGACFHINLPINNRF
jgi:signal transduction histidine kinase